MQPIFNNENVHQADFQNIYTYELTGNTSPSLDGGGTKVLNTSTNGFNTDNPGVLLSGLKAKNADRPIIAHININFLEEKKLNP